MTELSSTEFQRALLTCLGASRERTSVAWRVVSRILCTGVGLRSHPWPASVVDLRTRTFGLEQARHSMLAAALAQVAHV